jgi:hypothetical protein
VLAPAQAIIIALSAKRICRWYCMGEPSAVGIDR